MSSRTQQIGPSGGGKRNQEQKSYVPAHQRKASNYWFNFRSCSTKVILVRGWRFAPACCAAQLVLRRGPGCVMPLYRLAWAALKLHRHSELHQPSASAVPMKAVHASLSFGVRRSKWCGLTNRSTGPIAACRHLGYKSLAQMPARRNGPVSSNVRPRSPLAASAAKMVP